MTIPNTTALRRLNYHVIWIGNDPGPVVINCLKSLLHHHPNDLVTFWTDGLDNKPTLLSSGVLNGSNIEIKNTKELEIEAREHFGAIYSALDAGRSFQSKYSLLADMFRLVAIKKYGGVYLDSDTFVLKNLNHLFLEDGIVFCEEAENYLCSAVFACIEDHERQMLDLIELGSWRRDFDSWGFLGPQLFTAFWKRGSQPVRVLNRNVFFSFSCGDIGKIIANASDEINVSVTHPDAHGLHLSHEYLRQHGKQRLPYNVSSFAAA